MATSLSNKQAGELHKSIIAYLSAKNLSDATAVLRTDLNLGEDVFDPATARKYETLLERKWTSIIRLQRKIMDLESRNTALQSQLDKATPLSSWKQTDPASWLPGDTPRYALESHRDTINCIAFHPTFTTIATGSDDYTIKVWDWELGELETTIKGHTRAVLGVDFGGPKGAHLLASCSSDATIKLWDPTDQYKNIRTLTGHDHSVSAVRFIPSGVAGAPASGNLLVSASRDGTLKIWDVTTGFCVRTLCGHAEWVRDVCPSLDGRYILSTGDDMTARLWDITASEPEARQTMLGHTHINECCAFAPPSSYQFFAQLAGMKKPPPLSSAAEFMATGSRDKTIRLWDARGTCLMTLEGHDNWVRALEFHPSGRYLLSVSDDKTLRCWDLSQGGKCVRVIGASHERFINCLRWAPGIIEREGGTAAARPDTISEILQRNGTERTGADVRIRCVIATGGVDRTLRIFAN